MIAGQHARASAVVAACTFAVLLVALFLSPRSDSMAHQRVTEAAAILIFAAALVSLRRAALPIKAESGRVPLLSALLSGVIAYAPAISSRFISDDFTNIVLVRRPLLTILREQFTHGLFASFIRPIGFATLACDYRVWHTWAAGWHLTSLALHLATTASVFFLCKQLDCDSEISGLTALLFAVIPVNTEAVVWLSARFDLVATFFLVWTLIFYLQARRTNSPAPFVAALICFGLALFSKEIAYILPLGLVAVELLLFERRDWRAPLPFFALAALGILYRIRVLGSLAGYAAVPGAPGSLTLGMRSEIGLLLHAPSALLFAINWQQPRVVLDCLLAAATAALIVPLALLPPRGSRRLLAFALLWCFFAALPAQSMLMIPPTLTNTRELYFSSIGASLFLALLLARIVNGKSRRIWAAALVLCFLASTWHNIEAWTHASRITQDFLAEVQSSVPNPPVAVEFVFHDMPRWTEGGVYLLLNRALADSLCLTYGRDDLLARRSDEPETAGARPRIDMRWVGDWRGRNRPLVANQSPGRP